MHNPTSEIHQYVSEVISFSSEFGTENWSASKIRGPPSNLNVYGDCVNAWCPSRYNEDEFLEVKYDRAVYATKFRIYENLNGGTLVRIEVFNEGTDYETLWFRDLPEQKTQYNIFSPSFAKSNIRSNKYRFTFRCNAANYYSEYDAIELVGVLTNIKICEKTLNNDMPRLMDDRRYTDLDICFSNHEIIHAHKCILAIRCQKLHDDLLKNNNLSNEISKEQFLIVLDFLYTDKLSETKVKQAIETDKLISVDGDVFGHSLCLNKIMRFIVKYKLRRLESLILDYYLNSFFNPDNVLNVLVDASRGDFSTSDQDLVLFEAAGGNKDSIRLNNIEFVCLEYIRCNLQAIIASPKVEQLPKDVLISVLKSVAL
jgi:hypothetical protein